MKQWVNDMILETEKKPMPILSFPAIQLLQITVRELISNSDLQAEGMRLVAERADSLVSVSLMDLSLEAECFGAEIRYFDNEVPTVIGSVVSTLEDAKRLKIPNIGSGRTTVYLDAIEKAVTMINDRPVLAGVIGPFSLAGRLMDVTEAMIYCYDDPDMVHTILEKVTQFIINYILEYKKIGANGVVIAEPLAGLLSPGLAAEFSADYVKKVVDAVQDDSFIVVYHNCGNATIQQIDSILATGAPMVHFGNAIQMEAMMEHIPPHILAAGNIDPAAQFRNGTPESIRSTTTELLNKCKKYPNFVLSSGCDIPPLSKWENIDAFFEAAKETYQ
jgi:uroporphyrinogen decarboxylase